MSEWPKTLVVKAKTVRRGKKNKNTKRRDKLSDRSLISTKLILPKISEYNWRFENLLCKK